jgi:hypothetical protein
LTTPVIPIPANDKRPSFPSGICWQAVVLAMLNLSAYPDIGAETTPNGKLNLTAMPSIGMPPPHVLNLLVDPMIGAGVGGSGKVNLSAEPRINWNPATELNLAVTPGIGMSGHQLTGALSLAATPSIGSSGTRHVLYDNVGAGVSSSSSSSSKSWSATIATGASAVLVLGSVSTSTALTSVSGTVGSSAMTPISGSPFVYSGSQFNLFALGLTSPPTGTQTITVNFAGGGAWLAAADSLSYFDVSGFGAMTTNTGTGTALSVTESSASTQRVASVMATTASSSASFGSFNQTSRFNVGVVPSGSRATLIGDAAGASTVSFSATASVSGSWGAAAVPLLP